MGLLPDQGAAPRHLRGCCVGLSASLPHCLLISRPLNHERCPSPNEASTSCACCLRCDIRRSSNSAPPLQTQSSVASAPILKPSGTVTFNYLEIPAEHGAGWESCLSGRWTLSGRGMRSVSCDVSSWSALVVSRCVSPSLLVTYHLGSRTCALVPSI